MARKISPEREAAYQADRAFVLFLASWWDALAKRERERDAGAGTQPADASSEGRDGPTPQLGMGPHLVAGLENLERHYPAKARTGLKMALHDLLEMIRDFPQPVVDAVNAELRQRGLITLTDMRAREWRTIPKVLSRGRIKTDVEYYLLIERLNDVSTSGLTGEQRASLNGMVAEYESRVSRKP